LTKHYPSVTQTKLPKFGCRHEKRWRKLCQYVAEDFIRGPAHRELFGKRETSTVNRIRPWPSLPWSLRLEVEESRRWSYTGGGLGKPESSIADDVNDYGLPRYALRNEACFASIIHCNKCGWWFTRNEVRGVFWAWTKEPGHQSKCD
jgi:hypothetical protein